MNSKINSDSTLTCIPYLEGLNKYNLNDVKCYPRILNENGKILYNPFNNCDMKFEDVEPYSFLEQNAEDIVRIPLPRRSLLVFYGQARYQWEHCILREDITDRRVVIAYREFTPTYLAGGRECVIGQEIISKATQFW